MPKIVDYPETDRVAKNDVFLLDGAQGTRKALASWAAVELAGLISPINPKRVTTMRRKLKKLAVKVEQGKMSYENVENMFKGWMGNYYKCLSRQQREGIVELYETLFHKKVYVKNKKLIIVSV